MDWTDTLRLRESGAVDEFVNPNEADDTEQLTEEDPDYDVGPTHGTVQGVDAPETSTKKPAARKTATATKTAAPAKKASGFTRKR